MMMTRKADARSGWVSGGKGSTSISPLFPTDSGLNGILCLYLEVPFKREQAIARWLHVHGDEP